MVTYTNRTLGVERVVRVVKRPTWCFLLVLSTLIWHLGLVTRVLLLWFGRFRLNGSLTGGRGQAALHGDWQDKGLPSRVQLR